MIKSTGLQNYGTIFNQNNKIISPISTLTTEIKQFLEPETQKDVDKALTVPLQRLCHLQQGPSASYRYEKFSYDNSLIAIENIQNLATNIVCSTKPVGDTSINLIDRAKANISKWRAS
ncbi:hypothetical protein EPUL_003465 [Erysiphe pulchra]|uniref:Uncharacterized protein n=1 Tax=Erysiphe pulchra TaxID=225359 RepID=A0A2S4PX38_9PEZI|nr:hypothetical protein EPUL_003465 [Erysiphe pulchra]